MDRLRGAAAAELVGALIVAGRVRPATIHRCG
jgi:hypothetical protein